MYKRTCNLFDNYSRNQMINYGKYDEDLFNEKTSCNPGYPPGNSSGTSGLAKIRTRTPYLFDEDSDNGDSEDGEDGMVGCGCTRGLEKVCAYMKLSDECFETFTEKSMALTITLFKFIKVMDEFGLALELFIQSWNRIKDLIL